MFRQIFYNGQELKQEDLNRAFLYAENGLAVNAQTPWETPGVITGFQHATVHSAFVLPVSAGFAVDSNGKLMQVSTTTVNMAVDFAGASTMPSAGKWRWVTLAVRYGETLTDPAVDALGTTVYTTRVAGINKLGLTLLADATAAANNAGFNQFYVVAGTEQTIGVTLTLPSLPAGAVLLADLLITDGDTQADFNKLFYGRRQLASFKTVFPGGFPADPSIPGTFWPYTILWEIAGRSVKTRFYQYIGGLVITQNAAWSPSADPISGTGGAPHVWTADDTTKSAKKIQFDRNGVTIYQKNIADVGTPWNDNELNTFGWDSEIMLGDTASRSAVLDMDNNGGVTGRGVQTGYISLLGTGFALWNTIQFPRAFASTPSSVTFGAAGPNEVSNANTSSVAAGNLSAYGCDFRVVPIGSGTTCITQRVYTATQ